MLIVAGTLTTKMAGPLIRLWEQMPEPKWCVAMGDCTCSGGRYKRSYSTIEGIDRVMPVDVYVPGCPPRPEGLIYGMMRLQQLVKDAPRASGTSGPSGPPCRRTSSRWTASSARRLEARFGERLTGPVRQRHDQTEIRVAPGGPDRGPARRSTTTRSSTSCSSPTSRAWTPAATCRSSTTCGRRRRRDWLRVIADGMPRDDPRVPSLTGLWPGAEWMEREAYDMFGIIFEGNRDLRRIYMPPDYTSFPLRKDFYLPTTRPARRVAASGTWSRRHAPAAGDASRSSGAR